jgi:hypothetical protein
MVGDNARLIVDCRNAMKDYRGKQTHIVKA